MIKELLEYFNPSVYLDLWLLSAFLIAFLVAVFTFPTVLHVARAKQLMDEPGERSVHSTKTPTLGGIGIYLSLVVVITTIGAFLDTKILLLILGGMTVLFFLGLKDDLLILSPRKKFFGQLLAALLLIFFTDTRISGLSGFFGVEILPYWVSIIFTLFVYILIINAYNLIDGVDGLAGSLALFAAVCFTYLFVDGKDVSMATISVAMMGGIIPFLRLNFSSRNKIFMGDTGSMIVGFLLAIFAIRFINTTQFDADSTFYGASPIMALSIIFFPLLDTLRIFIIRIFVHKKSPFEADKNHLHHRFLQLGFSHAQTTGLIVFINAIIVIVTYFFKDLDIHFQFAVLLLTGTFLYSTPFIYNWLMSGSKSHSKASTANPRTEVAKQVQ